MKVAKKSPVNRRRTITLDEPSIELIEALREDRPKSVFVGELVKAEAARRARKEFYATATAAYTPEVSKQTLAINAQYPISEA